MNIKKAFYKLVMFFTTNVMLFSIPQKNNWLIETSYRSVSVDNMSTVVAPNINLETVFFQLGGQRTTSQNMAGGDCSMVTFGNIQILIDAGGSNSDYQQIIKQFEAVMDGDKNLEYIFVTHGDDDHICNLTGTTGILNYLSLNDYTVENYIDFDFCDLEGNCCIEEFNDNLDYLNVLKRTSDSSDNSSYLNYRLSRNAFFEVQKLKNSPVNYNKVTDLISEKNYSFDGDKVEYLGAPNSVISLSVKSESGQIATAKIKVLYNYYYDHIVTNENASSVSSFANNAISVCLLFQYGNNSFLFTGDLEEFDSGSSYKRRFGESFLVSFNEILQRRKLDGGYNNNIDVFKAGHHGSPTSNSEYLIDAIRPKYVFGSCTFGHNHYTKNVDNHFLCQSVLNNIFKYTDYIYPMSLALYKKDENGNKKIDDENGQIPFYGSIKFSSNGNIVIPSQIVIDDLCKPLYTLEEAPSIIDTMFFPNTGKTSQRCWGREDEYFSREISSFFIKFASRYDNGKISDYAQDLTLFKYGHIDVLLNCGTHNFNVPKKAIDNIRDFCTDEEIEYCFISNGNDSNYNMFVGLRDNSGNPIDGKEGLIDYIKINYLIDNGATTKWSASNEPYLQYTYARKYLKSCGTKIISLSNGTKVDDVNNEISNSKEYVPSFKLLSNPNYSDCEEGMNSLIVAVENNGIKYLNLGQIKIDSNDDTFGKLIDDDIKKSIDIVDLPNCGNTQSFDPLFFNSILNTDSVFICSGTFGSNRNSGAYPSIDLSVQTKKIRRNRNMYIGFYFTNAINNDSKLINEGTEERFLCDMIENVGDSDTFSYCVRMYSDRMQSIGQRVKVIELYAHASANNRSKAEQSSRTINPIIQIG